MSDIMDKVSDAITSTASVISDKAKEVSELTALRGKMRSQKKVIEGAYQEIGEQYYEAHKDLEGDYYAPVMAKITEAYEEIARLEKDIANIKQK